MSMKGLGSVGVQSAVDGVLYLKEMPAMGLEPIQSIYYKLPQDLLEVTGIHENDTRQRAFRQRASRRWLLL